MTIILVRHGETTANFARIVQGADARLNETGLQQAERVGARLRTHGAAHLVSSDQPRAQMTAEVIGRHTGLAVQHHAVLRERSMGDFCGRPYSEFTDFHPLAPDVNPPNGETWEAFHARVREAFAWVLQRRSVLQGPLIVVTHGLVLRSLFERVLQTDYVVPATGFRNTSISVLAAEPPHAHALVNCAAHLDVITEARSQV